MKFKINDLEKNPVNKSGSPPLPLPSSSIVNDGKDIESNIIDQRYYFILIVIWLCLIIITISIIITGLILFFTGGNKSQNLSKLSNVFSLNS